MSVVMCGGYPCQGFRLFIFWGLDSVALHILVYGAGLTGGELK